MKLNVMVLLASLALGASCKDVKVEKDLADTKAALADREDDLESSQKKLKAAESASSVAEERAKLAEAKLEQSDAKLKEAEAKLKAAADASVVSDPNAPVPSAVPSAAPTTGNATCDKYWAKFNACNEAALKNAPTATKEAMRKAFADAEKQTREAWKSFGSSDALETACKAMVDALSHNPNCPKQ